MKDERYGMIPSHANYHGAHKATHDNDYVEWEEE